MRLPGLDPARVKPGWYLLLILLAYAAVVTAMLVGSREELRSYRMREAAEAGEAREAAAANPLAAARGAATAPGASRGGAQAASLPSADAEPPSGGQGLWFPLPGAHLPSDDAHLPGAPRAYRKGVSQGFDFYGSNSGIPIPYGAPVVAAAAGRVIRADTAYREPTPEEWEALLTAVAEEGADEDQLDRLRGRQLWIETHEGKVLRYAHLSALRPSLAVGQEVYRGQVVGFVGNSGTDDGVAGTQAGARLHFEIWEGDRFFGQDMDSEAVRIAAASLFTGP